MAGKDGATSVAQPSHLCKQRFIFVLHVLGYLPIGKTYYKNTRIEHIKSAIQTSQEVTGPFEIADADTITSSDQAGLEAPVNPVQLDPLHEVDQSDVLEEGGIVITAQ